ncbi:hypothetical protein DFH09DRAFT_1304985 [Mycena vulgaris]|nr:hypothetical protein DFH09DRAFT_1304985 [Mycena vulgaris]
MSARPGGTATVFLAARNRALRGTTSLARQMAVCGTCYGWAPRAAKNTGPTKCTGSTPNAWPSGAGCISGSTACARVETCAQAPDGTYPTETFRG